MAVLSPSTQARFARVKGRWGGVTAGGRGGGGGPRTWRRPGLLADLIRAAAVCPLFCPEQGIPGLKRLGVLLGLARSDQWFQNRVTPALGADSTDERLRFTFRLRRMKKFKGLPSDDRTRIVRAKEGSDFRRWQASRPMFVIKGSRSAEQAHQSAGQDRYAAERLHRGQSARK
jgi:hypothetical protein